MKHKKKTTIVTIESRERTSIRRTSQGRAAWCDQCEAEVLAITVNDAAVLTRADASAIIRRVASGDIHFIRGDTATLVVCGNSLMPAEFSS